MVRRAAHTGFGVDSTGRNAAECKDTTHRFILANQDEAGRKVRHTGKQEALRAAVQSEVCRTSGFDFQWPH